MAERDEIDATRVSAPRPALRSATLLLAPVADGRMGTPAVFDVDDGDGAWMHSLTLDAVERRADDVLWIRYRVAPNVDCIGSDGMDVFEVVVALSIVGAALASVTRRIGAPSPGARAHLEPRLVRDRELDCTQLLRTRERAVVDA